MSVCPRSLMIISSDRISDWIRKGEVTARYFNPGDLFDEVHIVLLNQEFPNEQELQKLVGRAKFYCYRFPTGIPHFLKTFFWTPFLLALWARPIIVLASQIQPRLVRCHGANLNAFVALKIKERLGIPYVISLHINHDVDVRGRKMGLLKTIRDLAYRRFEKTILRAADLVLPVYQPIVPYLNRLGVTRFEVAYNFLNIQGLTKKPNYELHSPIRIISVGRQFKEKNPENIIRALKLIPNVEMTLVGGGIYQEHLKRVAEEVGVKDRVVFLTAISNDELCKMLPEFDIFATHSEYWEISKSMLEPLLAGLPVILNQRQGDPVPELANGICLLVKNTPDGYLQGLTKLISDPVFRRTLGERAYAYSQERWSPKVTEGKFVEHYKRVLKEVSNVS